MKLRNKKTGEIGDLMGSVTSCPYISIGIDFHDGNPKTYYYNSIAELNEEWEDYTPAEPLIKDKNHPERAEKARKALKIWADANGFKKVGYRVDSYVSVFFNEFNPVEFATAIEFEWIMEGLKPSTYTIAELCGEDEE